MAKYDLDSEEFANPKERANYVPRCPGRMRARLLGYEEFDTETDTGMKAEFRVEKILHDGTKSYNRTDRQWFEPLPSVGDTVVYYYGKKAKFAQEVARKGHEHRLFLAAAFDKEHTPELKVSRLMTKLASLHEDDELLDLEIDVVLEYVVQKISKPKEQEDGTMKRYVNGTLKAYGLSHVPPLKVREAPEEDEDEDDDPAPKRKAKTTSKRMPDEDEDDAPKRPAKRKPIDEDDEDEPSPKRKAKTTSKRKPIDEDDEDD